MKLLKSLFIVIKRFLSFKWIARKGSTTKSLSDKEDSSQIENRGKISERNAINNEECKEQSEKVLPRGVNVQKEYIFLGLDFGTSKTAVGAYMGRVNKKPGSGHLPISLRIGEDGVTGYIPSTVSFYSSRNNNGDSFEVGEKAERMATGLRVHSIKRCLACDGSYCEKYRREPYPWCKKDGKVHINNKKNLTPEFITRLIIEEALTRAKLAMNMTPWAGANEDFVIEISKMGCSAKFELPYREIIVKIVKELGYTNINVSDVVEEPVLAGLANIRYLKEQEGRFLIYDFGGGTFDSAVIEVDRFDNQPRITILSTAGDEWLGGDDIDYLISDFFISKYAENTDKDPGEIYEQLSIIERNDLRYRAKLAKESLTKETEFSDTLFATPGMISLAINRQELNRILISNKIWERSMNATMKACKYSHAFDVLQKEDSLDVGEISRLMPVDFAPNLAGIMSVGGVSKIPLIRENLAKNFGENKTSIGTPIDPITSVSVGAAINDYGINFSLNCLPYGFKLIGENDKKNSETIIFLEPYSYLDYFKSTLSLGWYCFYKRFCLQNTLKFTKFLVYYSNGDFNEIETNLGIMDAGEWKIMINIKGYIYLESPEKNLINIGFLPNLHPIQQKINTVEQKRLKEIEKKHKEFKVFPGNESWD